MKKTHQLNRMHLRKTDDEPKPKGQILGNYACPACKKEIYIDATRVGFSDTCLHCHANLVTGVLPKPTKQKPTPDAGWLSADNIIFWWQFWFFIAICLTVYAAAG